MHIGPKKNSLAMFRVDKIASLVPEIGAYTPLNIPKWIGAFELFGGDGVSGMCLVVPNRDPEQDRTRMNVRFLGLYRSGEPAPNAEDSYEWDGNETTPTIFDPIVVDDDAGFAIRVKEGRMDFER